MKRHLRFLSLPLFFLLFSGYAYGQWFPLPSYKSTSGTYCNSGVPSLDFPHPAANKVILYTTTCSGPHGDFCNIFKSPDDNQSTTVEESVGGAYDHAGYFAFTSLNDSVHAVVEFLIQASRLIYTTNNFRTIEKLDGPFIGPNFNLAITPHLVYMTSLTGQNLDSLMINNYSVVPNTKHLAATIPYSGVSQMNFLNDSTGFILCQKPKSTILKTLDYGTTWTPVLTDTLQGISGFSFPSGNTGYCSSLNGTIRKSTGGGLSWSLLTLPPTKPLNAIAFSTDSFGYAGGSSGYLIKTTDAGKTWTPEVSHDTNSITRLYTFGPVAYFTDSLMNLFKNMSPLGIVTNTLAFPEMKLYPNPNAGICKIEIKSGDLSAEDMLMHARLEIVNAYGQMVYSKYGISTQQEIVLDSKMPGIYYYRLISKDNQDLGTGKFCIY
jgi:hypothetical protein